VVGTLKAVQETARLMAEKRKADRLGAAGSNSASSSSTYLPQQQQQQQQQQPVVVGLNKTALLLDLQQERLAIDLRLGQCIAEPENTWLTTDIVAQATMDELNEANLRDIATFMVLVRDEMDAQVQADANTATYTNADVDASGNADSATSTMAQEVLDQLRTDLKSIQELRLRVAGAVSYAIADQLYRQILGLSPSGSATTTEAATAIDDDEENDLPIVLRLDEIQELLNAPPLPQANYDDDDGTTSTMPFTAPTNFMDVTNAKSRSSSSMGREGNVKATAVDPSTTATPWRRQSAFIDFVDLIPDAVIDATMAGGAETTATVGDAVAAFVDVGGKSFNAEIVTDDDFDTTLAAKRVATFRGDDVSDDDAVSEAEEPNIVTVAALRTLDVVFFVLEKFFTVAVPKAVMLGTNVVRRLEEAQQEGKGSKGWKAIRKTASAKGRY
jgi:hypothetical protein